MRPNASLAAAEGASALPHRQAAAGDWTGGPGPRRFAARSRQAVRVMSSGATSSVKSWRRTAAILGVVLAVSLLADHHGAKTDACSAAAVSAPA